MNWPFAIGVFFLVWWIIWFAVLPWGVRRQDEGGTFEPGTDPGAPQRPLLLLKVLTTTAIALFVFAVGYFIWSAEIIPLDRIPMPFDLPSR